MIGVGFVGAGMATQSIHLTALSTLGDQFAVRHVADPDKALALAVAARTGATASAGIETLLADESVDVVAVCSPDRYHADHVIAACEAGKRVVLCEKPLATSTADAERISAAAQLSGVHVVVGTMQAFDPAYRAARIAWSAAGRRPSLIRSVVWLPSVGQQVSWSTEQEASSYVSFEPDDARFTAEAEADLMRTTVLDLAVHNIALLHDFVSDPIDVDFAQVRRPFGYALSLAAGDVLIELLAMMWGNWRPDWTLDVWGGAAALHVEFPPSYVTAGSAEAEINVDGVRQSWSSPVNGYEAEWRYVADIVAGAVDPEPLSVALNHTATALSIADRAQQLVLESRLAAA